MVCLEVPWQPRVKIAIQFIEHFETNSCQVFIERKISKSKLSTLEDQNHKRQIHVSQENVVVIVSVFVLSLVYFVIF